MKKSSYTPSAETKRNMAAIETAVVILNRAAASDTRDIRQRTQIDRALLNFFAHNLDRKVRDNLEPQYDEAIIEMTRWLEGDKAAEGERLAQQD
jgi:hypothetical protein